MYGLIGKIVTREGFWVKHMHETWEKIRDFFFTQIFGNESTQPSIHLPMGIGSLYRHPTKASRPNRRRWRAPE